MVEGREECGRESGSEEGRDGYMVGWKEEDEEEERGKGDRNG